MAGQLWDSALDTHAPGSLLTDAQKEELKRRVADAEANPDEYVDWDDVFAATVKRLSQ